MTAKTEQFKNYLEVSGFEVSQSGRLECPVCGHENTASLTDGKIKCFHASCKLAEAGLITMQQYVRDFSDDGEWVLEQLAIINPEDEEKPAAFEVDVATNHKIYEMAAAFFHEALLEKPKYLNHLLNKRKRTMKGIKHFKVGLVNDTNRLLTRLLNTFSEGEVEDSGLYKYDGFELKCQLPYNTYIYPIWWKNKIRTMKTKPSQTSSETFKGSYTSKVFTGDDFPSFLNSQSLKDDEVILVEGENDCMRLWEMGKTNTVAILGSLSAKQIQYFKKLRGKKTVYLCFDNDEAGQKYTSQLADALKNKNNVTLKQITYIGEDPDTGENFNWEGVDIPTGNTNSGTENTENMDAEVAYFSERYVKVEVGSRIIYANKKYRNQWLDSKQLMEKHADKKKALKNWMAYHAEFAERGVCCDYSTRDYLIDEQFNMFEGFALNPVEGQLPEKYLSFVREVICHGNEENYTYILDWLSDLFQNPSSQTSIVPVIISEQGAGKNLFVSPIQKIIGTRYATRIDDIETIIGTYNGMLENKLFINLDEATFGKSKREKNRFKSLTGNPTVTINEKFKPPYEAQFSCRFIVTSNEIAPVGVEPGNRRYFVLEADNSRIPDQQYYRDIWMELDDEHLSALYHFLSTREISADYNRTYVKSTSYVTDMMSQTLDSVGLWLEEVKEDLVSSEENWKFRGMKDRVKLSDLHECYKKWYENNKASLKYSEQFSISRFGKLLRSRYWKDLEYGTFKFGEKSAKGFMLSREGESELDEFEEELKKIS
jgi:hypothetical protein